MNENQEKILKLAKKKDISKMGFREIAREAGIKYPQSVIHNLEQLKKKGLLYFDIKKRQRVAKPKAFAVDNFFNVPIVGAANCGPAQELAVADVQGYLRISPRSAGKSKPEGLFAVKAVGDSMVRAKIHGESVAPGDLLLVDCKSKPQDGNYVLSVFDQEANVKKFKIDHEKHEIRLVSESDHDIPPIIIHEDDVESGRYLVNGIITRVIKK
jgi:SOS-response transcriptional repressor LexA